jgi:hypothetical protein
VTHHPAGLALACFLGHSTDKEACCCCSVAEDFLSPALKVFMETAKESSAFDEVFCHGYERWQISTRGGINKDFAELPRTVEPLQHSVAHDESPSHCFTKDEGAEEQSERSLAGSNWRRPGARALVRTLREGVAEALRAESAGVEAAPLRRHEKRCLVLRRRGRRRLETDKKPIVLLVEVGIDEGWWTTADRAVSRVESFLLASAHPSNKAAALLTGQAAMLAVLTVNTKKDNDRSFASSRLGAFLCTVSSRRASNPGGCGTQDSVRMSLLWRQSLQGLPETSRAIGRTFRASCFLLPDVLDHVAREDYDFEYLGPSCCRRGNRVRSFAPRV